MTQETPRAISERPCYYVTAVEAERVALLADPYATREQAEAAVLLVRRWAVEESGDLWAHFYGYGVCRCQTARYRSKLGSIRPAQEVAMIDNEIFDDLFLSCAFAAYLDQAREQQGWPDCEATRRRAYRYYEEALADKNQRQAGSSASAQCQGLTLPAKRARLKQ